jgi:hypothetical protein
MLKYVGRQEFSKEGGNKMMSPENKRTQRMNNNNGENEMPLVDNASIFLRTPSYKENAQGNYFDGAMGNSENKINVSPFFNKK